MALNFTPEEKQVGKDNFARAVGKLADERPGVTRRDFMKGLVAAGAVAPVGAAMYFGYADSKGEPAVPDKPVKAALIGAGDEGGVLVGEHNPRFLEFVAYSDIRPSNQKRIFEGELKKNPGSPRRGFNFHYGSDARKKIKLFENYKELLADKKLGIEAVVIALPLHLHAPVTIDALSAGKHVLCEKLMAWNVRQCKEMIRAGDQNDRVLAIGHQRHYSMLYAHAVEVLKSGVLGDINHIRALWHRNNSKMKVDKSGKPVKDERGHNLYEGGWRPPIPPEDRKALEAHVRKLGYKDMTELVRWRLFQRTGGGLMAELGSHQLDACSIFLGAIGKHLAGVPEETVRPLAVTAVGGKYFYDDDSEVEDSIFCTFEFPGPDYKPGTRLFGDKGKATYDNLVGVTYSSINTNAFEPYGECVMGDKGTMVVQMERDVMLWGGPGKTTSVTVKTAGGGKPVLEANPSTDVVERAAAETGKAALGTAVPSRGYREEMEHLAYIVRMRGQGMAKDKQNLKPRCDGRHALADAVYALAATAAMKEQKRIELKPEWFDDDPDHLPEWDRKPWGIDG